jgi:hypothetical protein
MTAFTASLHVAFLPLYWKYLGQCRLFFLLPIFCLPLCLLFSSPLVVSATLCTWRLEGVFLWEGLGGWFFYLYLPGGACGCGCIYVVSAYRRFCPQVLRVPF